MKITFMKQHSPFFHIFSLNIEYMFKCVNDFHNENCGLPVTDLNIYFTNFIFGL